MNDSTAQIPAPAGTADPTDAAGNPAEPAGTSVTPRPWHQRLTWRGVALLAAFVLLLWQVIDLRLRIAATQEQLAQRLSAADAQQAELRLLVKQAQETGQALQLKLGAVEARVGEFEGQQQSLEGLYQELARGRDEWLLTEVDQLVGLATQQLQIAGNVSAAIQALSNAETRLARSQRPQFIGLRKALGHDLQRLRNVRGVDLSGISLRLESVALSVDQMGLAYESRPATAPAKSANAARTSDAKASDARGIEAIWQRWLKETWTEIRSLIHVERMDRPDPVVLAPNQLFFLRENLKLRLLSARVELLTRDQVAFRSEVKQSLQWIERYFDTRDRRVQSAIESLKPLLSSELAIEAPSLAESQSAVRAVKLPAERLLR